MHAPCPGLSGYLMEWQIRVQGPQLTRDPPGLSSGIWRNSRAELCETETWAEAGDTMPGRDASRPEADRLFGEIL